MRGQGKQSPVENGSWGEGDKSLVVSLVGLDLFKPTARRALSPPDSSLTGVLNPFGPAMSYSVSMNQQWLEWLHEKFKFTEGVLVYFQPAAPET